MKSRYKHIDFYRIVSVFLYIVTGVIVIGRGAVYFPDSYTFLDMAFNHSPMYCIFLKIFTSIFGDNAELPIILVQYGIIVFGIKYFVETLKSVFDIGKTYVIVTQLILLAPCVILHNLGSAILSEALSYPLFLVAFGLTLKMFTKESTKYIYKISLVLFILILTRGQFITLIPALILIVGYMVLKNKSFSKNIKFLIILLVLPFITSLSERVYNKVVFGHFVNNSLNYVHLITSPFYVSNESDMKLFTEKDEITYFNLVHKSLEESSLTYNQNDKSKKDVYTFYHENFAKICKRSIYDLGLKFYKEKGLNLIEQNIALNRLCKKMVFPLIKENAKSWITLFFKNLKNSFGSFKFMLFYFMLLIFAVCRLKNNKGNIYKLIVIATLFMFANNVLVAFVIHSIKRYIFYFDWVIFVVAILLFNRIFKLEQLNES